MGRFIPKIDWLNLNKPITAIVTAGIAYGMVFDNNYGEKPHIFSTIQRVWYEEKKTPKEIKKSAE